MADINILVKIEINTGNAAFPDPSKEVEFERIQPVGFLHLECNYEEDFPKEWEDEDDWDEEDDSEE